MPKNLFLNLQVADLDRSVAYFKSLGFTFNPAFSNENGVCMIINEGCYVMLLLPKFFESFTKKPVVDAKIMTEGLFAVSLDSKTDVDALVEKALTLGAVEYLEPEDLGFMYTRSIEDLDGHQWEFFYMNPVDMPSS